MVVVVGQSVAGRCPIHQDLDHKMVDKELVHHCAMDFLVRSSEAVAYSPCEAVVFREVVVVRPSSEAVERSVEAVDHNYRMVDILPRG